VDSLTIFDHEGSLMIEIHDNLFCFDGVEFEIW
jgi:hypothetical protein